jgi:hypothetical protein
MKNPSKIELTPQLFYEIWPGMEQLGIEPPKPGDDFSAWQVYIQKNAKDWDKDVYLVIIVTGLLAIDRTNAGRLEFLRSFFDRLELFMTELELLGDAKS